MSGSAVPPARTSAPDRDDATGGPIRVLFVCTGNSARSLMAEAILRELGGERFEVDSAGTHPRGVNPLTIRALAEADVSGQGLRSKDVADFVGRDFDWVVTVCDRAREACPVFPGAERSIHWGLDDPAEATGDEAERLAVFRRVLAEITLRIRAFIPLAERERAGARDVSRESAR